MRTSVRTECPGKNRRRGEQKFVTAEDVLPLVARHLWGSDRGNMLVIHQKNPIRIPFVMLRSPFLRVKTVL